MSGVGSTSFATPVGVCALAWSEAGIVAVQLPEGEPAITMARLRRRLPDAVAAPPPTAVADVCARVAAVLEGSGDDLADVVLDLRGATPFEAAVWAVARTIVPGTTRTYGEVAVRIGSPGQARAVGQALGHNPCPLIVPCHRVLAAHGAIGGFSAHGGATTKRRLLFLEGALAAEPLSLFDA